LLESEALCAEARRRTRLEDFGDPPIEPPLSILVNSLELEADLHPLGRFFMRVHLRELLETRLRLTHAWSGKFESLEASVIERPIFITGMPAKWFHLSALAPGAGPGQSRTQGLGGHVSAPDEKYVA
jgi:hypothetical protein